MEFTQELETGTFKMIGNTETSLKIREVAEKCRLADVRAWMLNKLEYPSLICDDGMHPNEAGHAVLAEVIDEHLRDQNPLC